VQQGKELRRFGGLRARLPLPALITDGKVLLTAGRDGSIRLWEAATGRERRRYAGHQGAINNLAFSPDGRLLVSVSRDTTAIVWDVRGR
jgi:WD40 repeat protein